MRPTTAGLAPRARLLASMAVGLLVVAACGASPQQVQESLVKVDSPDLVEFKSQIGLEECPEPRAAVATGENTLPDLTLPCLGGGPDVELRQLRGPMVLVFWAQWCVSCPVELPWVQEVADRLEGKVSFLGIDWQDTQPGRALEMLQEAGARFPSVADVSGTYPTRGLPRLVMIDAAGKVTYDAERRLANRAELEDLIAEHLEIR